MPTYRYRVAVPGGRVLERTTLAESRDSLEYQLKSEGNFVLEIKRVSGRGFFSIQSRQTRRLKQKDFFSFNQEFSVLLRSGLSIVAALDAIIEKSGEEPLSRHLSDIRADVFRGESLSNAFGKYSHLFGSLYVATLQAGERSGNIPEAVSRYIAYMKKVSEIRRKLVTASVYPVILAVVSLLVLFFLLMYVVPSISGTFFEAGTELPAITKLLIDLSTGIRTHSLSLLAGVVLVFVAGWYLRRTDAGGLFLDQLKLSLPFFGELYLYYSTARLSRTLSTVVGSGVTLLEAVRVSSIVLANRYLREKMNIVVKALEEGTGFSDALSAGGVFPKLGVRMISAGENSGALEQVLADVAAFYEDEVDTRLAIVTSAVEPGLMALMGLLIGFIVLALYLPIFQLAGTIG